MAGGFVSFEVMTEDELQPMSIPFADSDQFGQDLRRVMEGCGMAVVTGVLDADDCAQFAELKKLELQTESPQPGSLEYVQGEVAWKARLHPNVRTCFKRVFDTSRLSVGTDITSMFFTEPCDDGDAPAIDNPQWLHTDVNTNIGTDSCYQGVLYIDSSAGEACSTTVVWPKSHLDDVYGNIAKDSYAINHASGVDEATGVKYGHYLPLNRIEDDALRENLLQRGLVSSKRVPMAAGALLLWDSRTVHQGWQGGPRFAVPICWEPQDRVSAEARERKAIMVAAGLGTSHSPSEGRVHPCVARRRGVKLVKPCMRPSAVRPVEDFSDVAWEQLWNNWQQEEFAEDIMTRLDSQACRNALRPEIAAAL